MDINEVVNKSLFFLGAGASHDANCPMSQGMLSDIKRRISNIDDTTFNKPEKEALKFLLACLEYHSEWRTLETSSNFKFASNIEELALLIRRVKNREHFLPYPITGNWADKLIALEAEFQTIRKSDESLSGTLFESLDLKLKCILLPQWLCVDNYNLEYLNPIGNFFESYPNEDFRLDVFSLNNDLVFEKFFADVHARPWRGFVNGEWRGLDIDDVKDFGRLNLYKLHGSLDWVRINTGEFKENNEQLSDDDKENIEASHNPYVIFGQGTKTFSVEPFFSLVNHFRNKLKEKYYFFVIGYSFFDPYLNNLLFESVRGNTKKIIIVNPFFGPDTIKNTDGKLEPKSDDLFRLKYPDGTTSLDLASYMEEIQKNSFYSELPEFNIKRINPKSLEFVPLGTKDFFQSFFDNKGELFIKLIEEYEVERIETEEPF